MTYNETIAIDGVRQNGRRIRASVPCRALDDGVADDIAADQRGPANDMVTFFVRVRDWPYTDPPQVGDDIMREFCRKPFRVGRVTRLGDAFCIATRSR